MAVRNIVCEFLLAHERALEQTIAVLQQAVRQPSLAHYRDRYEHDLEHARHLLRRVERALYDLKVE